MVIGPTAHKSRPKSSVIIREQRERFRYTDLEGRSLSEDRGRDWSDASTSQGLPATARSWEGGTDSLSEPSEGINPTDTLNLEF